mmetsp:Transcript_87720/g.142036  ORF Transcript_87720/g.142036 Transcript_87720/m.142036 type:complete len:87 (+) Transcript_87720:551-811(+)
MTILEEQLAALKSELLAEKELTKENATQCALMVEDGYTRSVTFTKETNYNDKRDLLYSILVTKETHYSDKRAYYNDKERGKNTRNQ